MIYPFVDTLSIRDSEAVFPERLALENCSYLRE